MAPRFRKKTLVRLFLTAPMMFYLGGRWTSLGQFNLAGVWRSPNLVLDDQSSMAWRARWRNRNARGRV